jgi:glycosyltransferase involved in cell wall biosynthesis
MPDLSILIPARNEQFLNRTIEDIFAHVEGDTEIIVVLDGSWPAEPIPDNPRLTLIHHSTSIGQRAATNEAARLSEAKYLMKVDAHCAFDQGFDVKLMADMQDDWTMAPLMKNLHAFDWVCPNGHRRYQSPSGVCKDCGEPTAMDVVWIAKNNPKSTSYRFDKDLHFQYWEDYKKKQKGDLVESMSLQGSAFLVTRKKYFELDICDERHGSWGQQGTEVACRTWLSGGRVVISKKTWYAHLFRTQGADFGFPYPNPGIEKARVHSRQLWNLKEPNKFPNWDKAKYPLIWLIQKFAPVPEWGD